MSESETPICDLIEQLLSRDLSRGTLGQAITAARPIEAALMRIGGKSTARTGEKREKERARKAAYRARLSQNVPGTSSKDESLNKTQILDNKNKKESLSCPVVPRDKNGTSEQQPKAKRTPSRSRLPEHFEITPEMYDYAQTNGFADAKIGHMFATFRDYHRSKGNLMADWAAAWRTWVRNEIKFNGRSGESREANRRNITSGAKLGFGGIAASVERTSPQGSSGSADFFGPAPVPGSRS